MTFDWNDFQDLAKSLESNPAIPGPVEAALRSAASRAYYAAYNCALDYALTEDFVPTDRGSIHKQLQDYFQSKGISRPQYKKIGINLNRLKIRREEADYDVKMRWRPDLLAQQAIKTADDILYALQLLSEPLSEDSV